MRWAAVFAVAMVAGAVPAAAATSTPNDPFFRANDQWGLTGAPASINAPAAWCASTGGGKVVGDIDTGADFGHKDLAGKLIAGAAFLGGTATASNQPTGTGQAAVQDDNGHGTMTTGIVGAATNNGAGIAAVAPDAKMLIVKVVDSSGKAHATDVEYGMEWAVDHGANVLNVSLASTNTIVASVPGTNPVVDAINYAASHNVAVALAAGNNQQLVNDYSLSQVQGKALIVGALVRSGSAAAYNNAGANVYAPGGDGSGTPQGDVVSTYWTPSTSSVYGSGAGTSFAAPHAAGVLALLMSKGDSAQAAHDTILAHVNKSSPTGLQLDAAASLGVSPTARCGAGAGSRPAPRPTLIVVSPAAVAGSPSAPGTATPSATASDSPGAEVALAASPAPARPGRTSAPGPASPYLWAGAGFAAAAVAAGSAWLRRTGRI